MKHLTDIIGMADDLAFFGRKDNAYDIVMSLDFYTHAVYRKERQINPLSATPLHHNNAKAHQHLEKIKNF